MSADGRPLSDPSAARKGLALLVDAVAEALRESLSPDARENRPLGIHLHALSITLRGLALNVRRGQYGRGPDLARIAAALEDDASAVAALAEIPDGPPESRLHSLSASLNTIARKAKRDAVP